MAGPPLPTIRSEVREYLVACANLMAETEGAHDQFMAASMALQEKTGLYTDQERGLVRDMLARVCERLQK